MENDIPVDAALMEKFLITDSSTQVVLLYHSLSKIISSISKYGFSRMTYKEMLLYIAKKYYPHLLAELDKTNNIYFMLQIFQSSLFGFTEHKKIMDSIQQTHRQPKDVLTDFILTLKRKLKFLYLIKHKNMLEADADEKAEKFILNQNLLLKYLDTKMQENAYRIIEAYARQQGEEPPLRFMLQELDVLETQEGQNFTGQTALQKYNPIEVTKVAGLNLYSNQTDNISSHSLYTRKGAGPHPPPAGT